MNTFKLTEIGARHFEIDLRAWMCPLPKYAFEVLLPKLGAGCRLDLLVDCPGAITDIPNDAAESGCSSDVTQLRDGEWKISIRKQE